MIPNITLEDLLEAGVHFGHQTQRWHPKMEKYIFGQRAGIHLIDLKQTLYNLLETYEVVRKTASRGGKILFVGTKKQAAPIVEEEAKRCSMYYVAHRWLGGMLTNFRTIRNSVDRMKAIEKAREDGSFAQLTKKEVLEQERAYEKLNKVLVGIKDMVKIPDLVFVIDAKNEIIPVKESRKLGIPLTGICDTNTDPDILDYPIPANDDAIKSIRVITHCIADAVIDGQSGGQLIDRIDKESKSQKSPGKEQENKDRKEQQGKSESQEK